MTLCSHCLNTFSSDLPTYAPPEAAPLDLLSSNNPLGAQEVQGVQDRIADASSKLQAIDSKIEKLRSLLSEYETARETCENYINRHKRLFSLVHSIPPEIWIEVFQCVQMDHDRKETPGPFGKPLQLCSYGAVSSRWRNVAISTPNLWANIRVSKILPKRAYKLLKLALLRSNQYPLTVSICEERMDEDNCKIFSRCAKLLIRRVYRWRTLHVEISNEYGRELRKLFRQGLDSAPILETCSLRIEGDYKVPIIINAPLLKHVTLDVNNVNSFMPWLLPLSSVTSLELVHPAYFTADELADYLRTCPILEHVSLECKDDKSTNIRLLPSLTHHALKTLSIYKGRPLILSGLVAPTMSSLTLSCWLGGSPNRQLPTIQFIRNNPNLKSLCLDRYFGLLRHEDFQGITQITELVLSGSGEPESELSEYLHIFASSDVLPNTTSLVIKLALSYRDRFVALSRVRDIILDICQHRMQHRSTDQTLLRQITVQLSIPLSEIEAVRAVVDVDCILGLANMGIEGLRAELALTDDPNGDA